VKSASDDVEDKYGRNDLEVIELRQQNNQIGCFFSSWLFCGGSLKL
jgi:hypothetical protein